jgi:hypothetical protein
MMIGAMNDTRFTIPSRAPAHIPCFIFSRSLSCHIYYIGFSLLSFDLFVFA